jgi:hypothetical protein
LFKYQHEEYTDLTEMESELKLLEEIWKLKDNFDKIYDTWKLNKFATLEVENMEEVAND